IPRLLCYDETRRLLALELIPQAVTFADYVTTGGVRFFPTETAAALGEALATVHRALGPAAEASQSHWDWLSGGPPWAMAIHRRVPPVSTYGSPAQLLISRELQKKPAWVETLDSIHERWQPHAIVHGDIRGTNVLVGGSGENPPWKIRIIDWESVQLG